MTTGEWEPYISQDYKHGGVILHVVQDAFALKGLQSEFTFFLWARAAEYVIAGLFDGMAVTANARRSAIYMV